MELSPQFYREVSEKAAKCLHKTIRNTILRKEYRCVYTNQLIPKRYMWDNPMKYIRNLEAHLEKQHPNFDLNILPWRRSPEQDGGEVRKNETNKRKLDIANLEEGKEKKTKNLEGQQSEGREEEKEEESSGSIAMEVKKQNESREEGKEEESSGGRAREVMGSLDDISRTVVEVIRGIDHPIDSITITTIKFK